MVEVALTGSGARANFYRFLAARDPWVSGHQAAYQVREVTRVSLAALGEMKDERFGLRSRGAQWLFDL